MTVELWPVVATMLATALALAALIRNGQKTAREDARDNRAEIAALRNETAAETAALRKEMAAEIAALRKEMADEFVALRKETAAEFVALRKEMADRHRELGDRFAGLGERVAGVEAELRLATDLLRDLLGRRNATGTSPGQASGASPERAD